MGMWWSWRKCETLWYPIGRTLDENLTCYNKEKSLSVLLRLMCMIGNNDFYIWTIEVLYAIFAITINGDWIHLSIFREPAKYNVFCRNQNNISKAGCDERLLHNGISHTFCFFGGDRCRNIFEAMIRYYYFGIKWVFTCWKIRGLAVNGNVCNNTFFPDLNIAEIIKFIKVAKEPNVCLREIPD